MELRQLKYFVTLAKTLNFSKAAQELCITQGTLSQQIRQLEYEIGSALFERSSHSVSLTADGSELLGYARRTLDSAYQCSQVALDLKKGVCGELSIGVTHSFKYLVRNTISEFIRLYPDVRLNIIYDTASELLASLYERKIDFFVAFRPVASYSQIESLPLFDSSLSVIMRRGHPLAGCAPFTMDELRRHRLAVPSAGTQARKLMESVIHLDTSGFNVVMETNDPNIIIEIVSATNLLAITSSLAIGYRNDLIAKSIVGVDHIMEGCIHRLKGVYRKRSAELFSEMLMASAEVEKVAMELA